jgi:hypothetical protein
MGPIEAGVGRAGDNTRRQWHRCPFPKAGEPKIPLFFLRRCTEKLHSIDEGGTAYLHGAFFEKRGREVIAMALRKV